MNPTNQKAFIAAKIVANTAHMPSEVCGRCVYCVYHVCEQDTRLALALYTKRFILAFKDCGLERKLGK